MLPEQTCGDYYYGFINHQEITGVDWMGEA